MCELVADARATQSSVYAAARWELPIFSFIPNNNNNNNNSGIHSSISTEWLFICWNSHSVSILSFHKDSMTQGSVSLRDAGWGDVWLCLILALLESHRTREEILTKYFQSLIPEQSFSWPSRWMKWYTLGWCGILYRDSLPRCCTKRKKPKSIYNCETSNISRRMQSMKIDHRKTNRSIETNRCN